jgi:hypothetical protein
VVDEKQLKSSPTGMGSVAARKAKTFG